MIEQEIASIAKFLYDTSNSELYWDKVPEDFQIPAMYFPIPQSFNDNEAVEHFTTSYNWFIKIFQSTTSRAMEVAQDLAFKISSENCKIPLLNIDGSLTGKKLSVKNLRTSELDDKTAQLQISWSSVNSISKANVEMLDAFFIDINALSYKEEI